MKVNGEDPVPKSKEELLYSSFHKNSPQTWKRSEEQKYQVYYFTLKMSISEFLYINNKRIQYLWTLELSWWILSAQLAMIRQVIRRIAIRSVQRSLHIAFLVYVLCINGQKFSVLRNWSVKRRLLLFVTFLSTSFRAYLM